MKKALVLLLVLSFVGGVFAQELSFSGSISSGFQFQEGKNNTDSTNANGDDHVVGYDNNSGAEAIDFDLKGNFAAEDWGVKFGMTSAYTPGNGKGVEIFDAHAWMKLLNGIIILRGGVVDVDNYSAGGVKLDDPGVHGGVMQVEVVPIEGLSIGVSALWPNGADEATSAQEFFQSMAFGVAYSSDLFAVKVAAKLYSEGDTYNKRGFADMRMLAGITVKAIENLTIHFSSDFNYIMGRRDPKVELGLDVTYAINDMLTAQLATYFRINKDGATGSTETVGDGLDRMWFRPRVDIKINDNLSAVLRIPFQFDRYGWTKDDSGEIKLAFVGVDAWIKYTVGKAYIQPVYNIQFFSKEGTGSTDKALLQKISIYMGASF